MSKVQRGINLLSKEEKEKVIEDIISYFLDERDEEIGVIAASNLCEFIENEVGPKIYNKAVDDVQNQLQEKLEELNFTLRELKK